MKFDVITSSAFYLLKYIGKALKALTAWWRGARATAAQEIALPQDRLPAFSTDISAADSQIEPATKSARRPFTAFRDAAARGQIDRESRKPLFGGADAGANPYDIGRKPPGGYSPVDLPYVDRARALQRARLQDALKGPRYDR